MNSGAFVGNDGTCWKSITSGSCVRGRIAEHNVFKEKSGPTSYAKRNIENGYAISSWRPLIDESTTLGEIDAFISILYARGPYITIDEQLFPYKARCRFMQYMPSKPDKFGIKFWLAADVDSKCVLNGFLYSGKDEGRPENLSLFE
ncbi:DDE_Tnp_1_7 domain-containing protein [Trichonephila clavata]|uniref:DDE_Tnp_1_7 domain-containing protein n=1 Tax=Trichonephila clavata TaxID=2740835 RepID=A0A8X6J1E0_TRICU|nr:DDE_Tnp_1_7 domain-containing protein [Trichonephila clavata]